MLVQHLTQLLRTPTHSTTLHALKRTDRARDRAARALRWPCARSLPARSSYALPPAGVIANGCAHPTLFCALRQPGRAIAVGTAHASLPDMHADASLIHRIPRRVNLRRRGRTRPHVPVFLRPLHCVRLWGRSGRVRPRCQGAMSLLRVPSFFSLRVPSQSDASAMSLPSHCCIVVYNMYINANTRCLQQ
jgi:hypothetical protein